MVRLLVVFSPLQRREVRRGIEGGAVGFKDHAGRDLLGIRFLRHIHHKGSLALIGIALLLQPPCHGLDQLLYIRFSHPQIKLHVQILIVFLQIRHGNGKDVLKQGAISPSSLLQLLGG